MTAAITAALAVAGPELGKPLDRLTILVAIDRSRSIDLVPERASSASSKSSRSPSSRCATTIASAPSPSPPRPRPRIRRGRARARPRLSAPPSAATGPTSPPRSAAPSPTCPPTRGARRLVSDGVATRGDTMSAAAAAVAAEIPVDVVPLEQRAVPDVRVVGAARADPRRRRRGDGSAPRDELARALPNRGPRQPRRRAHRRSPRDDRRRRGRAPHPREGARARACIATTSR